MKLRLAGFLVTVALVVVLLGSLVAGLGGTGTGIVRTPATTRDIPGDGLERVRVEVLNGGSIPGLAREITDRLRDRGFDVVTYGNTNRDTTAILDRSGNPEAVARIAAELGIDRIEAAVDTSLYLEATVILGVDWPEIESAGQ